MLEEHLSCIYLSCLNLEMLNINQDFYCLLSLAKFYLYLLLVELVELSSRNLIVIVQQTNRGRLKGLCYSLFVNTRTQLNLNKIVISKQYVTNQKNLLILHQS